MNKHIDLHNLNTVQIRKLTSLCHYRLVHRPCWVSLVHPKMFFITQVSTREPHMTLNHQVSLISFCLVLFLSLSLTSITLTLLKTTRLLFCRMSLHMGFPLRHVQVMKFWQDEDRRAVASSQILSHGAQLVTGDANFHYLIEVLSARLLH